MPPKTADTADICGLKIKCNDPDGGGTVKVASCMTYKVSGTNTICGSSADNPFNLESLLPGTPSKCKCENTAFDIIIESCDIDASVSATCNEGTDQGTVALSSQVTLSNGAVSYLWSNSATPNETYNTPNVTAAAQGTWVLTATDESGCTATASVTEVDCCFFEPQCLAVQTANVEGCDDSDFPTAAANASDVFNMTTTPCGTPTFFYIDSPTTGALCNGGLHLTRTYTVFDDLDGDGTLDGDEVSFECVHTFILLDTTAPYFTDVPANITRECATGCTEASTEEGCAGVATATDTCSSVPTLYFNDTSVSGCGDTEVITRTWTAIDECGNPFSAPPQIIVVNDTIAPTLYGCPASNTFDCSDAIPEAATVTANDTCGGTITESYDCCFDITVGQGVITSSIERHWNFTDECGNLATCDQTINIACLP
jgi:hypothetical protein